MTKPFECATSKIREIIAGSSVPEDREHAENVLQWVLRLAPEASQSMQLAALAHDIERAVQGFAVRRGDYSDYDMFKEAHARNSALLLREILDGCGVEKEVADVAVKLVERHETGGDEMSDLLKHADAISFFEVNLPKYFEREGVEETFRRCVWGYRRLSKELRMTCLRIDFKEPRLKQLVMKATDFVDSQDTGLDPAEKNGLE